MNIRHIIRFYPWSSLHQGRAYLEATTPQPYRFNTYVAYKTSSFRDGLNSLNAYSTSFNPLRLILTLTH